MHSNGGGSARSCAVAVVVVIVLGGTVTGVGMALPASAQDASAGASPASSTLVVDDDGGQGVDYRTIQVAVDNADAGDTIQVNEGWYNETVRIAKPLTLVGDAGNPGPGPGPNAPVLDGGTRTGSAITLVNGTSGVTIVGFEIRDYSRGDGIGTGSGVAGPARVLRNVTVRDTYFHRLGRWGIGIGSLGRGQPENLTIANNRIERVAGTGVRLTNVRNVAVIGNRIRGGQDIVRSGLNASSAIQVRAVGEADVGETSTVRLANNIVTGRFAQFEVIGVRADARAHDAFLRAVVVRDNRIDVDVPRQRPVAGISVGSINRSASGTALVGDVTLRNNTVNDAHSGVRASAVNDGRIRNVTVERTHISNVRRVGIALRTYASSAETPATGTIEGADIRHNEIARGHAGINVLAHGTSTIRHLSVTGNEIADTDHDSVTFTARDDATLTNVTARANQVRRGKAGITIRARGAGTTRAVKATNNTVDRSQFGVFVNAGDAGTLANVTLSQNTLRNSEDDGIAIPRTDQAQLGGVTIEQNAIRNNGDDGIDLIGESRDPHGRIVVHDNRIINSSDRGLSVGSTWAASEVLATRNVFVDNGGFGVANFGSGTLNATRNWWGASSGPSSPGNSVADPVTGTLANGTGDEVSDRVRFDPWLTTDPRGGPGDVTGGGTPARDPDGDGLYEDVNGDGDVTPGDATVLFDAVFEGNPVVTENVESFDFNGDGSVTPGDATVLFDEVF